MGADQSKKENNPAEITETGPPEPCDEQRGADAEKQTVGRTTVPLIMIAGEEFRGEHVEITQIRENHKSSDRDYPARQTSALMESDRGD